MSALEVEYFNFFQTMFINLIHRAFFALINNPNKKKAKRALGTRLHIYRIGLFELFKDQGVIFSRRL